MAEQKDTFDPVKYKNNFNRKNYDQFLLTVPKGEKELITAAAKAAGFKSRNEFILEAIREKMAKTDSL